MKWMEEQEARTLAEKLVHVLILWYGASERIHSNQGRTFEAQLLQMVVSLFIMVIIPLQPGK